MVQREHIKSETHISLWKGNAPTASVCSLSLSLRRSWCGAQWGLRDERNHPAKMCANGSSKTLTALANSRDRMRDRECQGREERMTERIEDKAEREGCKKPLTKSAMILPGFWIWYHGNTVVFGH